MVTIPDGHWDKGGKVNAHFIPIWEKQLRERIAAQPDAATRFGAWLARVAEGRARESVRLWFIEQPYLAWAEAVEKGITAAEQNLRKLIAEEIADPYER